MSFRHVPSRRGAQRLAEHRIDGAWSLYLPVLKLVEPRIGAGVVVLGENAFDPDFRNYLRDPANGYLSQQLEIDPGRGNEFAVRTA